MSLRSKSIPFTQRSDDGTEFTQVDVSGSNLVIRTDENGYLIGTPFSGNFGTAGTSGTSGTSGENGTSGTSGSSGENGSNGSSGENGTSGSSGSAGTAGTSGLSFGTSGESGTSGTSGESGTSGTSGTSGENGTSGESGTSGSSGANGLNMSVRSDFVSSTSYIGVAPPESATDQSVWTITKTIFDSAGNITSSLVATNVKWDDRLTEVYV